MGLLCRDRGWHANISMRYFSVVCNLPPKPFEDMVAFLARGGLVSVCAVREDEFFFFYNLFPPEGVLEELYCIATGPSLLSV